MYLKFVLKENLSVLKSFVLSIFYLAVEKRGGGGGAGRGGWYQRNRYVLMWGVCDSPLQWGVGGLKLLFFCVTYFLNDPL